MALVVAAACTDKVKGNVDGGDTGTGGDIGTGGDTSTVYTQLERRGDFDVSHGVGVPKVEAAPPAVPPAVAAPIVTNSGSARRDGWYPDEPGLSPAVVASASFGRRFDVTLPGADLDQIYAQPLYYNGRVFIASEANNVYSLDAATGAIAAEAALGTPWNASDLGCGDLLPTVGVTSTPVIDPASNTVYLELKTYDPPSGEAIVQVHALDVMTLAERTGFPVEITGVADNDATQTFNAAYQHNRPGLLLMNGVVYIAFSSHCDTGTYNGWVVGVRTDGHITAMFATETGPNVSRGSGIWQSGSGLMSDGDGRIFFMVGNSFSNAINLPVPGNTPPPILDEAMVRLSVLPSGMLEAQDFFIPYNVRDLDDNDNDFGSGGPVQLIDTVFGNAAYPHLAIGGGKSQTLYIWDRDNLGGFQQGPNQSDGVLGQIHLIGGMWSRPGVWPGEGGYVYLTLNSVIMHAFAYAVDGSGVPSLAQVGHADVFGFTSGSPIITSDGYTAGSAVVWAANATNSFGTGELRAYSPIPDVNASMHLLFHDSFGPTAKYIQPAVGNGRLYIGTYDGHVIAYGAPDAPPLTSPGADFGLVTIGTPVTKPVTFTAAVATTVTALTSANTDYSIDTSGLPVTLAQGQTFTVNVTLSPVFAGPETAALDATTAAGSASASLRGSAQSGTGTLSIPVNALDFGPLVIGDTHSVNVLVKNTGATPFTFSPATLPALPFTVTNLPANGSTLVPGASVVFTVTYHPTGAGTASDQATINSSGGNVVVTMTGSASTPGFMTITPSSQTVDIGPVAVGSSGQNSFTIQNTGGTYIVIAKSKPPTLNGFTAVDRLDEGTRLNPNDSATLRVQFAPTTTGPASATWTITATDGQGARVITFTGTGTP